MMLRLYTAISTIVLIGMVSCAGSDNNDYIDKTIVPAGTQTNTPQSVVTNPAENPANTVVPNTINPGSTTIIPGTNTINVNPQANPTGVNTQSSVITTIPQQATNVQAKASGNINPAHGQPGHRCDIAVGAPLDSKPGSTTAQPNVVTTQQPAQNTVITQQPAKPTLPGMNPPHGEPGHRCDITVGAPLDSKPATTTVTPAATTTGVPPLLAPAKPDRTKN